MNTSEKIRALRESKGLSQDQLAKEIGVDRTTIVKYESGGSKPTRSLQKLADYFGVSTDYLLGRDAAPAGRPAPELTGKALTPEESKHLEKYRALDEDGREAVDNTLDFEYTRRLGKSDARSSTTTGAS